MDSILDVKQELVARSQTASLDDLKSKGRTTVKVIRAEHIAAMVEEAVQKAVGSSGLMSKEEVDALVDRSSDEFRSIVKEREQQIEHLRNALRQLESSKEERVRLEAALHQLTEERDQLREMLEAARQRDLAYSDPARRELDLQAELEAVRTERDELAARLGGGQGTPSAPVAAGAAVSPDLVMRMMQELAELKANMGQPGAPAAHGAPAAVPGDPGIAAALEKMAGTLNDRLEKFGRKMGISSAVEGQQVSFDGLFNADDGSKIESNMDSVQVKQKSAGGIGANLERLKKLKKGG